jgi:hypothetical protein
MSGNSEREERALEGLIVSRIRAACDDKIDLAKLPILSDKEKASLKCLQPGFIEKLIKEVEAGEHGSSDCVAENAEHVESEFVCGLNRADQIDDAANEELERKRRELLDKLKEERNGGRDRDRG